MEGEGKLTQGAFLGIRTVPFRGDSRINLSVALPWRW